jgi:hypothetical protein
MAEECQETLRFTVNTIQTKHYANYALIAEMVNNNRYNFVTSSKATLRYEAITYLRSEILLCPAGISGIKRGNI